MCAFCIPVVLPGPPRSPREESRGLPCPAHTPKAYSRATCAVSSTSLRGRPALSISSLPLRPAPQPDSPRNVRVLGVSALDCSFSFVFAKLQLSTFNYVSSRSSTVQPSNPLTCNILRPNSFPWHSYENCRRVYPFFAFWHSRTHQPSCSASVPFALRHACGGSSFCRLSTVGCQPLHHGSPVTDTPSPSLSSLSFQSLQHLKVGNPVF